MFIRFEDYICSLPVITKGHRSHHSRFPVFSVDDNAYVRKCFVFTKPADRQKENRQRQVSDAPFRYLSSRESVLNFLGSVACDEWDSIQMIL